MDLNDLNRLRDQPPQPSDFSAGLAASAITHAQEVQARMRNLMAAGAVTVALAVVAAAGAFWANNAPQARPTTIISVSVSSSSNPEPSTSQPATSQPSSSQPSTSAAASPATSPAGTSASQPGRPRTSTSAPLPPPAQPSRPSTVPPTTTSAPPVVPSSSLPTTSAPSTSAPTTTAPSTSAPTTEAPTTSAPTTEAPTTSAPTTEAPTTSAPTTSAPTTSAPTTSAPTTSAPTTTEPTTSAPTTTEPTPIPACRGQQLVFDSWSIEQEPGQFKATLTLMNQSATSCVLDDVVTAQLQTQGFGTMKIGEAQVNRTIEAGSQLVVTVHYSTATGCTLREADLRVKVGSFGPFTTPAVWRDCPAN